MFTTLNISELNEERREKFFVPDTHLSTPLYKVDQEELNSNFKETDGEEFLEDLGYEPDPHKTLFLWISSLGSKRKQVISSYFREVDDLVEIEYGAWLTHFQSNEDRLEIIKNIKQIMSCPMEECVEAYIRCRDTFSNIVNFVARVQSELSEPHWIKYLFDSEDIYCLTNGKNHWWISEGRKSLVTYEFLLMASDIINQRTLTLTACCLASIMKFEWYPSSQTLLQVYDIFDHILAYWGNEAYKIIKNHESIINVFLQSVKSIDGSYGIADRSGYANYVKKELKELEDDFSLEAGIFESYTLALQGSISNPDHLSQLFGIYRHWGHPYVRSSEGIKANRAIAEAEKTIDYEDQLWLEDITKDLIFTSYWRKNKRYPSHTVIRKEDQEDNNEIIPSHFSNALANNHPLNFEYSTLEWRNVIVGKEFEPSLYLNLLDLIQDKACGLKRSEVKKNLLKRFRGDWKKRRVISSFIANDSIDLIQFLDSVNLNGLDPEDLTIGVTPKERELKSKPRLFSLMSMNLKYYFGATEQLIKNALLPFIEEITMSDSALDLVKKQYEATKNMGLDGETESAVLNIDFSKWNLNFRNGNTRRPFRVLDNLFGYEQVISRTHDFFEQTLFYCSDGREWPTAFDLNSENLEGDLAWVGQGGGCEGLRQKGWTIITAAVLRQIARKHEIKYKLLGQGDNQVMVITLSAYGVIDRERRKMILSDKLRAVVLDIFGSFDRLGLPIKREETWVSSSVFAYGKVLIVNGIPRPMSLKKIARCYHQANEDYPTIDTSIASIFANSQAATNSDYSFCVPHIIAMRECWRAIEYHLKDSILLGSDHYTKILHQFQNKTSDIYIEHVPRSLNEIIKIIMLGHTSVGGYPVQHLPEYLSKGFPDSLSLYLAHMQGAMRYCNLDIQKYRKIQSFITSWMTPLFDKIKNYENLMQSPTALNILGSASKVVILKYRAQEVLGNSNITKNSDARAMYKFIKSDFSKLTKFLIQINPFPSRVVADFFASTPPGQASKFVSKFDSTKTLRLIAKENGSMFFKTIQSSERQLLDAVISQGITKNREIVAKLMERTRDMTIYGYLEQTCTTKLAQLYRDISWGIKIIGVTTAAPLHLLTTIGTKSARCKKCITNKFVYKTTLSRDSRNASNMRSKLGPYQPYLGSKTVEKISTNKEWSTDTNLSYLQAAVSNLRQVGWVYSHNSNMHKLILKNIEAFTDVDTSIFMSSAEYLGGNWAARYEDAFTKHGGFINSQFGPYTHLNTSITSSFDYEKLSYESTIQFQSLFCSLQSGIVNLTFLGINNPSYHHHLECPSCLDSEQVTEPLLGEVPDEIIPSAKELKLFWKSQEIIISHIHRKTQPNLQFLVSLSEITGEEFLFCYAQLIWNNMYSSTHNQYDLESYKIRFVPYGRSYFKKLMNYVCYLILSHRMERLTNEADINLLIKSLRKDYKSTVGELIFRLSNNIFYPLLDLLDNSVVTEHIKYLSPKSRKFFSLDTSLENKCFIWREFFREINTRPNNDQLLIWVVNLYSYEEMVRCKSVTAIATTSWSLNTARLFLKAAREIMSPLSSRMKNTLLTYDDVTEEVVEWYLTHEMMMSDFSEDGTGAFLDSVSRTYLVRSLSNSKIDFEKGISEMNKNYQRNNKKIRGIKLWDKDNFDNLTILPLDPKNMYTNYNLLLFPNYLMLDIPVSQLETYHDIKDYSMVPVCILREISQRYKIVEFMFVSGDPESLSTFFNKRIACIHCSVISSGLCVNPLNRFEVNHISQELQIVTDNDFDLDYHVMRINTLEKLKISDYPVFDKKLGNRGLLLMISNEEKVTYSFLLSLSSIASQRDVDFIVLLMPLMADHVVNLVGNLLSHCQTYEWINFGLIPSRYPVFLSCFFVLRLNKARDPVKKELKYSGDIYLRKGVSYPVEHLRGYWEDSMKIVGEILRQNQEIRLANSLSWRKLFETLDMEVYHADSPSLSLQLMTTGVVSFDHSFLKNFEESYESNKKRLPLFLYLLIYNDLSFANQETVLKQLQNKNIIIKKQGNKLTLLLQGNHITQRNEVNTQAYAITKEMIRETTNLVGQYWMHHEKISRQSTPRIQNIFGKRSR
jgi:hypothetical protein